MANIDMTQVLTKANELGSIAELNKALKRVASVKSRLNKAPGMPNWQDAMTACLQEYELLKRVRDYMAGPRKTASDLTAEDIDQMNYDEVLKALNSIWSKKAHTRYADDCKRDEDGMFIPGSGVMFQEACRIEEMLKARRDLLKPVGTTGFSKASMLNLIETLRACSDLDVTTCLDRIEAFVKGSES